MELREVEQLYIDTMVNLLSPYQFIKKRKNALQRKVNDCTQEITVVFTKLRGTEWVETRYNVSYSYPIVNQIAAYIQGVPYRKGLSTGIFHTVFDAPVEIDTSNIIKEQMTEQDIIAFAQQDAEVIATYFVPLLEKSSSPDKFLSSLKNKDKNIEKSIVTLNLSEWTQISILLYIGQIEEAVRLFDNWTPISYYGGRELPEDERQFCRWRIANWIIGNKVPKDYALYGRQGNGIILPVPKHFND